MFQWLVVCSQSEHKGLSAILNLYNRTLRYKMLSRILYWNERKEDPIVAILATCKLSSTQPPRNHFRNIHNFTEQKTEVAFPPPPPIIFERQILSQQTIYRWKGNLTASRIHFKYWENILILRLYEQFSRNDSAMASEWLSEKISNQGWTAVTENKYCKSVSHYLCAILGNILKSILAIRFGPGP